MRSIDFYEFAGVVVPGAALLAAVGIFLDVGAAEKFLSPDAVGNVVVYLVLAYVTGHFIQAVGNGFEAVYWRLWKGMPTDWPITRLRYPDSSAWRVAVETHCGSKCPQGDVNVWRRLVAQARSSVYSSNRATRLNVFNGNYGMFRGLLIVELVVAAFAWKGDFNTALVYVVLVVVTTLTWARLHRFAIHYARELFANVAALNAAGREGNTG